MCATVPFSPPSPYLYPVITLLPLSTHAPISLKHFARARRRGALQRAMCVRAREPARISPPPVAHVHASLGLLLTGRRLCARCVRGGRIDCPGERLCARQRSGTRRERAHRSASIKAVLLSARAAERQKCYRCGGINKAFATLLRAHARSKQ